MSTTSIAITKLQPPRLRAARIVRARLDVALRTALHERRVVLLTAPAGFGKTSALAQQLAQRRDGTALAWLALDEDDDAPRLFLGLAAALEPLDLPWRTAPEALAAQIGDGGPGRRRAVAELVNALAAGDAAHGVIVLDDLHRIGDADAHALLDALIERLPPQWTLVLSSRVEPPLALARWRAADELAEFTLDDLRFSADEASELAAIEGSPVAAERLGDLYARTQGWPAGLRLALAALRTRREAPAEAGAPGPGGHARIDRHLFDFLASEVLDDMPAALHDFLLRSSVLPVLTADRGAAVSADARAAEHLAEIERRGLFVTVLDAAERTLVLHDLFRDALGERLRRLHGDELPALLKRAAAGEPDPARRIGYLQRAGDWAAAEAALAAAADEMFLAGGAAELHRLVDAFDPAWRTAAPRLLRLRALARSQRWQWAEMAQDLEAALHAAEARGDAFERDESQALLAAAWSAIGRRAEAASLLAGLRERDAALAPQTRLLVTLNDCIQHFERGELAPMPALYARVIDGLEQGGSLFTWWQNAPAMSWSTLRGMRPVLERYSAGVLVRCGERELPVRAMAYSHQAYTHLWAGRIDAALAAADVAESEVRWLACSTVIEQNVVVLRLLVNAMQGRAEAVALGLDALYHRGDDLTSTEQRRIWQLHTSLFGVRLTEVLGGDPATLQRWAERLADSRRDDEARAQPSVVPARLAAARGRWDEAAALYEAVLPQAPRLDLMGQCVELQLRAGHALWRAGRPDAAAAAMQPALERMRLEGERGHALMCGPALLAALDGADWHARLSEADRAELHEAAALAARLRGSAAPAPAPGPAGRREVAYDQLSSREREVLERIAAGDSNKVIARVLDISPHTVKRHVANILDKLALASRGQAAAWLHDHSPARTIAS